MQQMVYVSPNIGDLVLAICSQVMGKKHRHTICMYMYVHVHKCVCVCVYMYLHVGNIMCVVVTKKRSPLGILYTQ